VLVRIEEDDSSVGEKNYSGLGDAATFWLRCLLPRWFPPASEPRWAETPAIVGAAELLDPSSESCSAPL
jgi:hypothetical protein